MARPERTCHFYAEAKSIWPLLQVAPCSFELSMIVHSSENLGCRNNPPVHRPRSPPVSLRFIYNLVVCCMRCLHWYAITRYNHRAAPKRAWPPKAGATQRIREAQTGISSAIAKPDGKTCWNNEAGFFWFGRRRTLTGFDKFIDQWGRPSLVVISLETLRH